MISALDVALLVLAGVAAGLVGSAGGITSLISFPALLAVGLPAHAANVANSVGLVACLPGSAHASRPELRGRGAWLKRWSAVAAIGGTAGAVLLLVTPDDVFARVVPFLVAAGSLALLFEPRLTAWHRQREGTNALALPAGILALALYNGYFGAGSGVMTLTLMLVLVDDHLPTANALKNVLIGVGSVATATILVLAGPVEWAATVPIAAGLLVGSRIGPVVARRLPPDLLRVLIVVFGLALAVDLWINPST
ncbi:sulfite exporter TauE/SafE family protein [Conexibacter woesei]|uniref:sulfite exporter TauE/SafE family protein n=1 Tax=Conexibacter woesei TaxID=191495 RepID=UPI000428BB3E|nr:sulfite exporter TauE/SafE family protein [Conexibacter woesei]